jgi:hypothetical protein
VEPLVQIAELLLWPARNSWRQGLSEVENHNQELDGIPEERQIRLRTLAHVCSEAAACSMGNLKVPETSSIGISRFGGIKDDSSSSRLCNKEHNGTCRTSAGPDQPCVYRTHRFMMTAGIQSSG